MQSPEIQELIKCLSRLPGLGSRSGRRAALHLIKNKESHLWSLLQSLKTVNETVRICQTCFNIDTVSPCSLCTNPTRHQNIICVVEDVVDLWALERTHFYKGLYFCLGGVLSALQGITPENLNIPKLLSRIKAHGINEVVLALSATMDGQTTIFYLKEALTPLGVKVTTLAQGVPLGGELDYLDDGTLMTAFQERRSL